MNVDPIALSALSNQQPEHPEELQGRYQTQEERILRGCQVLTFTGLFGALPLIAPLSAPATLWMMIAWPLALLGLVQGLSYVTGATTIPFGGDGW